MSDNYPVEWPKKTNPNRRSRKELKRVVNAMRAEQALAWQEVRYLKARVEDLEELVEVHKALRHESARRERAEAYVTRRRHEDKTRRLRRVVDHFRRKWTAEKARSEEKA